MLPAWIIEELRRIEAEEAEDTTELLYLPIDVEIFDEEEELHREILIT